MSHTIALRLICGAGALTLALGCGRVIAPEDEEPRAVCAASEEWHVVDERIDERAGQALLWFDGGPIVATHFRSLSGDSSSLEHFDARGDEIFRAAMNQRVSLITAHDDGFLAVGQGDGSPRRLTLEYHAGVAPFTWRASIATEEDFWPAAAHVVGDALLVIGSQEPHSGADKDVVVYGFTQRGEPRFSEVFGEEPPVIGQSRDERVVGSYVSADLAVIVSQTWIDGAGGPVKAFAVDSGGEKRWEYSDAFQYARGTSWTVTPTSDGGALITGSPSAGGIASGSARLLRLDAAGKLLWERTLKDPVIEEPEVMAAAALPSGGFFLTGLGSGPLAHSWILDEDGAPLLAISHDDDQLAGAPSFSRVEVMPSGGVLLASEKRDSAGGALNLLRVDEDGQALWQHRIAGAGIGFISDLIVSPDDHVVLAGRFAKEDSADERHVLQLSDACQLTADR
ncbi:MAG: hypothetical protein R3B89_24865 [Polyangiaceae bacterium]